MSKFSNSDCLQKVDSVITRAVCDETLLVPLFSESSQINSIYTLNESASLAWALLDGSRTLAQVSAAVAEAYQAAQPAVEADVRALIDQLLEMGFVEAAKGEPGKGEPWKSSSALGLYAQPKIMEVLMERHQQVLGFCNTVSSSGAGYAGCVGAVCFEEVG